MPGVVPGVSAGRFADAIRRVGGEAFVIRGDERLRFAACVQPRTAEAGAYADALGAGDGRGFVLYAAAAGAGADLAEGDVVEYRGDLFRVVRLETMQFGGVDAYRWGLLRPVRGG